MALRREYYFAHDTLYMAVLVLVTIYSAIHVLAQCFILFAKSKQNGSHKNSFPLKWDQFWLFLVTFIKRGVVLGLVLPPQRFALGFRAS